MEQRPPRFAENAGRPANDFVGVGIDPDRRRGRGAETQPLRPLRAARPRGGRRRLGVAGGAAAAEDRGAGGGGAPDHHPQQIARHLLRPLDQSLSRLRAWLRLLLRAADARLYGPVAGARFRDAAVRQAERGAAAGKGAGQARLPGAHHGDRHQYRSLSADRAALPHHARDPRGARPHRAIRSASSPSRRWSRATSTSCRAWRSAAWSRWRCR